MVPLLMLLWVGLPVPAGAMTFSDTVALDADVIVIGERAQMLVDDDGLAPARVMASTGWAPVTEQHPNVGFTSAAVWFRFTLRDQGRGPYVLTTTREWVDDVRLYEVKGGAVELIAESGARIPVAERPVVTESIAFPIQLEDGAEATYWLRIESRTPISFRGVVMTRDAFTQDDALEQLLSGGYYAILFGLGIYSVLLYVVLRIRIQLWVGAMLITYAVAEVASHGHMSRLLPVTSGGMELRGSALGFAAFCLVSLLAAREAAQLADTAPRAERVCRWVSPAVASMIALAAIRPELHVVVFIGLGIMIVLLMALGIWGIRCGLRDARYMFIAVISLLLPGVFTLGVLFGWLPAYRMVEYGNHAGAVLMSLMFSLLIADSIRRQREDIAVLSETTATLNEELEARLVQVERAVSDAEAANRELRYQVVHRSRSLVDTLARLSGPVHGRTLPIGEVFEGRYRVLRELGSGGWGVVYEVERTTDGQHLAIKVLTRARSGPQAARLAREAEIGARLEHDNVVSIVDLGVMSSGSPFLVMELVEGGSLEDMRFRFGDRDWALPLLLDTAQGLAALHAGGVIHRDIKPGNVLVDSRTRRAMVTDFGIARPDGMPRLAEPVDGDTLQESLTPQLTADGALVGTPAYMPPEAGLGTPAGVPGDVFAFGLMAYEMLGNTTAYEGCPVYQALAGEPLPEPRRLDADELLPGELADVLWRCVAEDPGRRPTMDELLRHLKPAASRSKRMDPGATLTQG